MRRLTLCFVAAVLASGCGGNECEALGAFLGAAGGAAAATERERLEEEAEKAAAKSIDEAVREAEAGEFGED